MSGALSWGGLMSARGWVVGWGEGAAVVSGEGIASWMG